MAIQYARENNIPFFGICLGMQCASIEFARNVCNLAGANSTEFDPATPHPVISLLEEQRNITKKGGTMRLGAQACFVEEGTKAYEAYKKAVVSERHRHRYEFNDAYKENFLAHGMRFSGHSQEDRLVEIMEIINHPWFVCVQFHPEFKSKPTKAHPLFREFIRATLKK